jgi:hypothetical protein
LLLSPQKDSAGQREALEQLLDKHGLNAHSDPKYIQKVKKKIELERDMDGIDMSNILDEVGGRGRRRAAAKVDFK